MVFPHNWFPLYFCAFCFIEAFLFCEGLWRLYQTFQVSRHKGFRLSAQLQTSGFSKLVKMQVQVLPPACKISSSGPGTWTCVSFRSSPDDEDAASPDRRAVYLETSDLEHLYPHNQDLRSGAVGTRERPSQRNRVFLTSGSIRGGKTDGGQMDPSLHLGPSLQKCVPGTWSLSSLSLSFPVYNTGLL